MISYCENESLCRIEFCFKGFDREIYSCMMVGKISCDNCYRVVNLQQQINFDHTIFSRQSVGLQLSASARIGIDLINQERSIGLILRSVVNAYKYSCPIHIVQYDVHSHSPPSGMLELTDGHNCVDNHQIGHCFACLESFAKHNQASCPNKILLPPNNTCCLRCGLLYKLQGIELHMLDSQGRCNGSFIKPFLFAIYNRYKDRIVSHFGDICDRQQYGRWLGIIDNVSSMPNLIRVLLWWFKIDGHQNIHADTC